MGSSLSASLRVLLATLAVLVLFASVFAQGSTTTTCKKGSFIKGGKCKLCPPGTYKFKDGATSCLPCPTGTHNGVSGAQGLNICLKCPAGTFNLSNRPYSRQGCKPCGSGTNSAPGSSRCGTCPPEKFINSPDSRCVNCPSLTIASKKNSLECNSCSTNSNSVPNKARTKCDKCRPGFGARVFQGGCERCSRGASTTPFLTVAALVRPRPPPVQMRPNVCNVHLVLDHEL